VHVVKGFGGVAAETNTFLGDDAQTRRLEARVDRAGQVATGRVGLDDRKGAFYRHRPSLRVFIRWARGL
jgi:hypothetical protein